MRQTADSPDNVIVSEVVESRRLHVSYQRMATLPPGAGHGRSDLSNTSTTSGKTVGSGVVSLSRSQRLLLPVVKPEGDGYCGNVQGTTVHPPRYKILTGNALFALALFPFRSGRQSVTAIVSYCH
ncbi:hypothetical protein BaRGS_00029848 [Batillaria attramentaria]|uniref:Uncharacterized protein n=1 Tax=Batillaria attramentaria TaxID=370345 RepID=A0ABD0JUW2_9CAEN